MTNELTSNQQNNQIDGHIKLYKLRKFYDSWYEWITSRRES